MIKENCIFCKIANGEIPSKAIFEDNQFKVILDLNPASRGHTLILTKNHYDNLYELPEDVAAEMMKLARNMSIRMTKILQCDGLNLVQNNGEEAGQTIFHFHMHLIPRYKDMEKMICWNPKTISQGELDDIRNCMIEEY